MKFPRTFTRYVGTLPADGIAIGSDTTPTGPLTSQPDNVLFSRFSNINGWPVHRIAVVYSGPAGAPSVVARGLMYEDSTGAWYQIGADVTMQPGRVSFFDIVALLEMPNVQANLDQATSGSVSFFLQVDAPVGGSSNGAYMFAMGPDLTTQA